MIKAVRLFNRTAFPKKNLTIKSFDIEPQRLIIPKKSRFAIE